MDSNSLYFFYIMKCLSFKVQGTKALMMHNPQCINPFNEFTKLIKPLTSKKKKTEEDMMQLYKLQFMASLYMKDGQYIIPAQMFWKAICTAAKEQKLGKKFEQSLLVPSDCLLDFDDKDCPPDLLFDDENLRSKYVDIRDGVIMRARVPICRSIFPKWKTTLTVWYDETQLDEDDVVRMVEISGLRYGVGTYRRIYGRYETKKI